MASWVEFANTALQQIGEEVITSLTDDSDRARAVNRIYQSELRTELRLHPWNCARKRVQLATLTTAPTFGPAYQFQLPSDFVRLLPDAEVTDWQIEGRKLLSDDGGPLDVVYIYEITDPNELDPLLVEAYVARLAMKLCERLTMSSGKRELAVRDYTEAVKQARKVNAFESISATPPEDPWVTARL